MTRRHRGPEVMARVFWTLATPFATAGHRLGLWSYKWVNVCHGARKPGSFTQLWQHRWYRAAITRLPNDVALCGIEYMVSVSEGTVVFTNGFSRTRIIFDRDPFDDAAMLWYVTLSGRVPADHCRDAYSWVCAVFGGSFVTLSARPGAGKGVG